MKYFAFVSFIGALLFGSALNGMDVPEQKPTDLDVQVCILTTDNKKVNLPEFLVALSPVLKQRTSNELPGVCSAEQLDFLLRLMNVQKENRYNDYINLSIEIGGLISCINTQYTDNKVAQVSVLCSILKQACAWSLTPLEQFLRFYLTSTYKICTPAEYASLPKDDLKICGIVPLQCENTIFIFAREIIDLCPYLKAYVQRAPGMNERKAEVLSMSLFSSEHLLHIKNCLEILYYHQSLCRPQLSPLSFGSSDPCVAQEFVEEKIEQYVLQYIRSLPTISFDLIQSVEQLGLLPLAQSLVNEMNLPEGELTVPENLCWYFYNRLPWTRDNLVLKLKALENGLQHKVFTTKQINEMIDEMLKTFPFDESTLTILERPEHAVLCQVLKNGLIRQNVGPGKRFRLFGCWGGDLSPYLDKLTCPAQPNIIREPGAQCAIIIGPEGKPHVINQNTHECIRVLDCSRPIHSMEYLNESCFIAWGNTGIYRCNWQTGEVIELITGPCSSSTIRAWDKAYAIIKDGMIIRIFFFPEYASLRHLFALLKNVDE